MLCRLNLSPLYLHTGIQQWLAQSATDCLYSQSWLKISSLLCQFIVQLPLRMLWCYSERKNKLQEDFKALMHVFQSSVQYVCSFCIPFQEKDFKEMSSFDHNGSAWGLWYTNARKSNNQVTQIQNIWLQTIGLYCINLSIFPEISFQ